MMKRLALVLMLMVLSSTVQARDYEAVTTLHCVWPDGRIESFREGNNYRSPIGLSNTTWTVMNIHQYPATIRVRLEALNKEKNIDFNNGWPCRIERDYTFTDHEADQPESDNFTPAD